MRYNHFDMLPEKAFQPVGKRMTLEGGGSAPSGPTNTTVTNTNIPDYAQPYVMNMLNAAQSQIYNPSGTGFNAYTPYSSNPSDYVASMSPLQQQAQSSAANLQVPGQYNFGSNLAAQAGIGSLGAANQAQGLMGQSLGYGNQGAMFGNMAANMAGMGYGAGQNFANQATNPYAVQAYMNPYLQSSLQPQLQEMQRQYGITGQQEQANATQQGAFGGSREALMAAENERNKNTAMNQAIGQGYNTAFNNAQAQQLAAANLGLQGMQAGNAALNTGIAGAQTGLQGVGQGVNAGQYGLAGLNQAGQQATNLANIGTQQLGAEQGVIGTQAQQGATQQAQQQNIINQAIQNYATAQQYPFMQLGLLNSMLRGLPMQQASTSMYQAAPSTVSQLAGLGTAGLGLSSLMGKTSGSKRGGLQEDKVERYDVGGAIPMKMMNNQQLQQVQQSPSESAIAKIVAQGQLGLNNYMNSNPQAAKVMSQPLPQPQGLPPQQQVAQMDPNRTGLGAIGTGDMTRMAGGGILAFADGEKVPKADPLSPADVAYDQALHDSWLAKAAGTGLDYTVGLPITAGKALLGSLSGLYESAHPTYDKSGNIVKKESKKVDKEAEFQKSTEAGIAAYNALQDQKKAQAQAAVQAANPAAVNANGLAFDKMMANNPSNMIADANAAPPAAGLPGAGNPGAGTPSPVAAPKAAPAGIPMPAAPQAAPQEEYKIIHTQFGDVSVPASSPLAGLDLTKGNASTAIEKDVQSLMKSIEERKARAKDEALIRAGLGMMSAPARTGHNWADALTNLGVAGTGALNYLSAQEDENTKDLSKINTLKYEAAKADQARDLGLIGNIATLQQSKDIKDQQMALQEKMHRETLAASAQNLQARLAEINANKQLSREEKEREQQRLMTATASGELTRIQNSAYTTISKMHPELPADEIQRQADVYTYNVMSKGPYASMLNLPKPSDTPITPEKQPSWWDKHFGGTQTASAPQQSSVYSQVKASQQ